MQLRGMPRQRVRIAVSAALGLGAAAVLAAASGTETGNPHLTSGLLLLLAQVPGEALTYVLLAHGDDARAAPAAMVILIAVNAACYAMLLYLVLWWRDGKRHTLRVLPYVAVCALTGCLFGLVYSVAFVDHGMDILYCFAGALLGAVVGLGVGAGALRRARRVAA